MGASRGGVQTASSDAGAMPNAAKIDATFAVEAITGLYAASDSPDDAVATDAAEATAAADAADAAYAPT